MSFINSLEKLIGVAHQQPQHAQVVVPTAAHMLAVSSPVVSTLQSDPGSSQIQGDENPGYSPLQNTAARNPQLLQSPLQNNSYYDQQQPNQVGVTYNNLQALVHPIQQQPAASGIQMLTPQQARQQLGLDHETKLQPLPSLPTNFQAHNGGSYNLGNSAPAHQNIFQRVTSLF